MFLPISLLIFFVAAVNRPDRGSCPDGYGTNGINRAGVYECRPRSLRPDVPVSARQQVDNDETLDARHLASRIWCTGGSVPVAGNDGTTVGCQMEHH